MDHHPIGEGHYQVSNFCTVVLNRTLIMLISGVYANDAGYHLDKVNVYDTGDNTWISYPDIPNVHWNEYGISVSACASALIHDKSGKRLNKIGFFYKK